MNCNKSINERIEDFKRRSIEKYGDVIDFSKMDYKNAKTEIVLIHKKYGEYKTTPDLHLRRPHWNMKTTRPFGYFNNKANCIEVAKQYKSKKELERKCNGCYKALKRNGWLDEVVELLYDNSIHYMNFNEKINSVYVYEFVDENTFYVGRTNNIKRRDRQHRIEEKHSDGTVTYDSVYMFAKENNILIPEVKILEKRLTATESQEKENYWKEKYISEGWETLNKGVTGINKGSLGAVLKWTYEKCKEEAKKYRSKNDFKIHCQSAYTSSVRHNWINDFFQNKKKIDGYWDVLDNVLNAAKECKGAKDMIKRCGGAYNSARKHGWTNLLKYKNGHETDGLLEQQRKLFGRSEEI